MNTPAPSFETEFQLSEIPDLAKHLIERFSTYKIWLFEGELGAGKTTLIQHLVQFLGVEGEINSPTFSLVNEYKSSTLEKIYHLDLYRLTSLDQVLEIGLYEIEESGYYCMIEWASAVNYLPDDSFLLIRLDHSTNTTRRISIWLHEN
jgi:tRNA threonylcarbamoyladenosine biosynthesis protein TsaE